MTRWWICIKQACMYSYGVIKVSKHTLPVIRFQHGPLLFPPAL